MGYFKSVSKKRKRIRKIRLIIFILILLFIIIKFINIKVTINDKYLKYIALSSLGIDYMQTKEIKNNTTQVFYEEQIDNPIVYIYNTHQTESYKYDKLNAYNIDYTVMFASYILQDYLYSLGINSIVETSSISKLLNENNLKYSQSYKASRILLEQSIIDSPTLKYFIDIHRDSSVYEKTTCEIDNIKYAKLLFILGLENEKYLENKVMIEELNNKLKNINDCLSRGILEKQGIGVDGVYNQDFNPNTILIEVGGQYNNIEEVNNSLKVLASILYEYIMEDS